MRGSGRSMRGCFDRPSVRVHSSRKQCLKQWRAMPFGAGGVADFWRGRLRALNFNEERLAWTYAHSNTPVTIGERSRAPHFSRLGQPLQPLHRYVGLSQLGLCSTVRHAAFVPTHAGRLRINSTSALAERDGFSHGTHTGATHHHRHVAGHGGGTSTALRHCAAHGGGHR